MANTNSKQPGKTNPGKKQTENISKDNTTVLENSEQKQGKNDTLEVNNNLPTEITETVDNPDVDNPDVDSNNYIKQKYLVDLTEEEINELNKVRIKIKVWRDQYDNEQTLLRIAFNEHFYIDLNQRKHKQIDSPKLKTILLLHKFSPEQFDGEKNYIKCPFRLFTGYFLSSKGRKQRYISLNMKVTDTIILNYRLSFSEVELFETMGLLEKYKKSVIVDDRKLEQKDIDDEDNFDF